MIQQNKEKRNKVLVVGLIMLLVLLAVILGYQLMGAESTLPDNSHKIGFKADQNATQGELNKSNGDIVAALNQKVAEGMINISMNTNPTFADGKAKGTLMITNSTSNRYPQMVEIYTKDNNELVYSGGVEVGHKIETSTLAVELAKGTYDCIAYFHAVDPNTGERIGTAAADIKITVKS